MRIQNRNCIAAKLYLLKRRIWVLYMCWKLSRIAKKINTIECKYREDGMQPLPFLKHKELVRLCNHYNHIALLLSYHATITFFRKYVEFHTLPDGYADKFIHPVNKD